MKNFTPEDLLEYHYDEMPANKRDEVTKALQEDWTLKHKMNIIEEAAERLDKSTVSPRKNAVNQVLEYAAAHAREHIH